MFIFILQCFYVVIRSDTFIIRPSYEFSGIINISFRNETWTRNSIIFSLFFKRMVYVEHLLTTDLGIQKCKRREDNGPRDTCVSYAVEVVPFDFEYVGVVNCDVPTGKFDFDVETNGTVELKPDIERDGGDVSPTHRDVETDMNKVSELDVAYMGLIFSL